MDRLTPELVYCAIGLVTVAMIAGALLHKYLPSSKLGVIAGNAEHYIEAEYNHLAANVKTDEPVLAADVQRVVSAAKTEVTKAAAAVGSSTLSGVESAVENALVSEAVSLLTKGMSALLDTTSEDNAIAEAKAAFDAVVTKAQASKDAKAAALASANANLAAAATTAVPKAQA